MIVVGAHDEPMAASERETLGAHVLIAVIRRLSSETDMGRIHVLGAITLAIFTGPMPAGPARQTSAAARQILPRTLVPSHYDLSLTANPEALTFKGDVQITSTSGWRLGIGRRPSSRTALTPC